MSRTAADPKGLYRALNLSPGASDAEIRLAYTFLKRAWHTDRSIPRGRVQQAFHVLSDPDQRAAYDGGGARALSPAAARGITLAVTVAGLAAVAAFIFPGYLLPSPEPYRPGVVLVERTDGSPLGEVLQRQRAHPFPQGVAADAYLIRREDGVEVWLPASDLERHFRPR